MTARQVYEAVMIEVDKVKAPSILLEEFNYLFNKAIKQYINKKYNVYDVNQQSSDDLRVLKSSAKLTPFKSTVYGAEYDTVTDEDSLYGAVYEVDLPLDYLHILNCICTFKVKKQFKCYNANTIVPFKATRLTADLWSESISNFYLRPSYKRPYYYIHNVNTNNKGNLPTNPYNDQDVRTTGLGSGTDIHSTTISKSWNDFLIKHQEQNYTITRELSKYNAVSVVDETLIPKKTSYYKVTDPYGNDYCVVYNYVSNSFELSPESTMEVDINNETIVIVTTGTKIRVVNGVLHIDNKETNTYYALVTDLFLLLEGSKVIVQGLPRSISTDLGEISTVEREAGHRYGNPSNIRMEIRYGKDDSLFILDKVFIDYIKTPQEIRLTQELLDLVEDTSQIMEYQDYVCQEIINELTHIVMENVGDPRLQTHIPISLSIANPAQALAPQK